MQRLQPDEVRPAMVGGVGNNDEWAWARGAWHGPLPPYWRIEPPRPIVFVTNPAPRRLVHMIAAGIRVN